MFVLQVAADIFGVKTNFELTFPSRPSVIELSRSTETAFSNEIALRRPDHVPPHSFHVAKMKFYDEDRNKWLDLQSEAQLAEYTQIYAFQPENQWHRETQREIPAAVKPPPSSMMTQRSSAPNLPMPRAAASSSVPQTSYMPVMANQPRPVMSMPRSSDATDEEKVRTVFTEFDLKNTRMIDIEDLKQGFRTLGMEFTSATMSDLFQKGDLNSDGRISYTEFERFARMYPIMIDCLFYRSRAFWDDQNMQREIDAENEAVRGANALVEQAKQQHQNAVRTVEEATNSVIQAESDLKDKNGRLREVAKEVDQAQRDKDRTMKEKYDKENDAVAQKDRERQARQVQQDAAREAEKASGRAAMLGQEAAKMDDRVRALQQQLAEAQRAADRANQAAKQGQNDADNCKQRAIDASRAADNISREVQRFDDALRQAEQNYGLAVERIRELEQLGRDLSREAEDAVRRREALERQISAAKEHEQHMSEEVSQAKRNAEERERLAKQREAELVEQQRQRQLLSQQERALIEQELRLREQRESLEEKETKLKAEAQSFLSTLRTSYSTPRMMSYQRDVSATTYGRPL